MLNIPVDKNIRTEKKKKYSSKFKQKFEPKVFKMFVSPFFSPLLCWSYKNPATYPGSYYYE